MKSERITRMFAFTIGFLTLLLLFVVCESGVRAKEVDRSKYTKTTGKYVVEERVPENENGHVRSMVYVREIKGYDWDKSEEYGINSTSCYDLNQYLDEDGNLPIEWLDDPETGMYYSGRWAYPELMDCRFYTDVHLTERTDRCEVLYASDSKTDSNVNITIFSGLSAYSTDVKLSEFGRGEVLEIPTESGIVNVMLSDSYDGMVYSFPIGNFSINVHWCNDERLTEEELIILIDNIILVGDKAGGAE